MSVMVHKLLRHNGFSVYQANPLIVNPSPTGRVSIKRRWQLWINNFVQVVHNQHLPAWMVSWPMRLGLSLAVVGLSVAYLMQLTSASSQGYQLHEFEKQVAALERETNNLRVEVATNQALSRIEGRITSLPLVPVTQVRVAQTDHTGVVARR